MKKYNWIILVSKDRGTNYGVGTFIKQLSIELSRRNDLNVFILEIGISINKFFSLKKDDKITILEIPVRENISGIDTKKNQEKLSKSIARIALKYIPSECQNVIHMNFLFQYFIAMELKNNLNGKILFTQHVFYTEHRSSQFFNIESHVYNDVDKIITVTKHGKDHLLEKGLDTNSIEVVYNGIDPNQMNPSQNFHNRILEKYGLNKNEKLILYSGRIDPIKGLDFLCKAIEGLVYKMNDFRLVFAGDGNYNQLFKSARKISVHVSYLGFIPYEDVVALYHIADIGVIPSLEEHCSYVALEMLHAGLPVVASSIGGLKEIFNHEQNAFLVKTINDSNVYGRIPVVEELEKYMYMLLNDDQLKTDFSKDGKERAGRLFTSGIMVDNYIKIVNELL
ncbi:glycosyltransferase family 4 protein [Draconibacterium sp. IB214405]|uniref:glycosyltransferase family 4 protein n=1 Tax=Draconibacterium sp. IB214405 TaxID=3097352 RepID=UPI002A0BF771|nr:glycosyltransferase family 4 protein [Draconibacterium sp. IB214405]MDX8337541.1 glycosyltransferase family 4 protein [Draconibacterium sp. IB214405]